jgi:hypothetical protein
MLLMGLWTVTQEQPPSVRPSDKLVTAVLNIGIAARTEAFFRCKQAVAAVKRGNWIWIWDTAMGHLDILDIQYIGWANKH